MTNVTGNVGLVQIDVALLTIPQKGSIIEISNGYGILVHPFRSCCFNYVTDFFFKNNYFNWV